MLRRLAPVLPALLLVIGCAGPSKLAQKSEENLAAGENARAREAATAAGNALARDWENRITALATSDSLAAAEQVLDLTVFRARAVRYAAVTVSPEWAGTERALRNTAARTYYQHAVADLGSRRPKKAFLGFEDVQRFIPDYRDVAKLSDRAYQKGLMRIAFVPFAGGNPTLCRDVAASWRDDLAQRMVPPDVQFTRILG